MYFDSYWDNGKIPPTFRYSRDHEMEIIIACVGAIMRKDFRNINEKTAHLNGYFEKYFKSENYKFGDSLRHSYKTPTKIEEIAKWFNKHKVPAKNKLSIIQLLIDVAMADGELIGHEYDTIKYLHTLLKLPIEEFDQIVAIHLQRAERMREDAKQKSETRSYVSKESQISNYCKVLGIEKTSDKEIIKKAYRNLVKIHHPDKFASDTELHQQLAKQRFVEIQLAYEKLLEISD